MPNWIIILLLFLLPAYGMPQDTVSLKKIQGSWKELFVVVDETGIPSEALPVRDVEGPIINTYSSDKHWVIQSNKLSIIEWPCSMSEQHTIDLYNNMLRIVPKDSNSWEESYFLSFHHDTLVAESPDFGRETHYFLRERLPQKQLANLLTGKINPECLYGDWEIPVGEVSVPYDAIVVGYPFILPAELHIKSSNLHWYWANNRFYLEVDGVKRPFKVISVSKTDENMWLMPEKWINTYKNPDPELAEPDEYYKVWLRRTSEEE